MLHLVTGVPGATKTAFVVTELDKTESSNKVNLLKNSEYHKQNKPLIEKFQSDFTYRTYEVGSGHELKNQIDVLQDDYFDFLEQEFDDLRPDFYYQRVVHYNEIIERINNRDGEQGFKILLPVRPIYTNINALKIDYVRALTYDWRDCPDGSIIVIDEVQLVEPYSDIKTKDNPIVQDLTIHRHRGFDFWFITQSPTLLHPTVKVLIGVHFHLTRPYGMTTVVYRFGSCKDTPNAMVNKQNCEAKFNFSPQQRIFKLYKSTTINTHKKRFPKGIWFFLAWIILGIVFFIYTIFSGGFSKSSLVGGGEKKIESKSSLNNNIKSSVSNENLTEEQLKQKTALQEQQLQFEIEKQKMQMVAEYQSLQIQLIQQDKQLKELKRQIELSKSMLPIDYEVIKASSDLQVRGVMMIGNECKAYNENGTLMVLSQKDCSYYLKESGRVWKSNQSNQILNTPEQHTATTLATNAPTESATTNNMNIIN